MTQLKRFMLTAASILLLALVSAGVGRAGTPTPPAAVDEAPQNVVRYRALLSAPNGAWSGPGVSEGNRYEVPAGKRLIIEQINLHFEAPPGQRGIAGLTVHQMTPQGLKYISYPLVLTYQGASISPYDDGYSTASLPVRLYADESSVVFFGFMRTAPSGSSYLHATFSGYLVDMPVED